MIKVQSLVVNTFFENTYVVYDETKECVIIDPGCYSNKDKEAVRSIIYEHNLKVTHIINTHCHIDHVLGNQYLKDMYGVELYIHADDLRTLEMVKDYASQYGYEDYLPAKPDVIIKEGETIQVGNIKFKVMHVPGHSPGHVALYVEESKSCFSGDVLFLNSIGRTDLPGGNHRTLIESIKTKLFPLGDDVTIYPGHGPNTSIGQERNNNPYLKTSL